MVAVFEQGVRLGLAAAVGLAAMSAGGADAAGMPPAVYRLGTAAAAGAFAVTVLSVEPSRAASGCASDAAPCVAVVVRSSIQNVSPAPEALADIPSLRLLAADGAIVAPVEDDLPAAPPLAPGRSLERTVAFSIGQEQWAGADWLLLVGDENGPRITLR